MPRPHWRKRWGMEESPGAAIAGAMNTAAETRNAIVPAENRRGVRTRLVDISSSLCWSGHYTVGKWELKSARIHAAENKEPRDCIRASRGSAHVEERYLPFC